MHLRVTQGISVRFLLKLSDNMLTFLIVDIIIGEPEFVPVEVSIAAAASVGEEGVRQDLTSAVERIPIPVVSSLELHQDIRPIAVHLLERQAGVLSPHIESSSQNTSHGTCGEAAV